MSKSMNRKLLASAVIILFFLSIIPVLAEEGEGIDLTVTVIANILADAGGPYSGYRDRIIIFDGTGSSDPDGEIVSYSWDFNALDGIQEDAIGATTSHTYDKVGTYEITLTVTDDDGFIDSDTTTVTVTIYIPPPVNELPVADAGADRTALLGSPAFFDGSGSSDSDGSIVSYYWRLGDGGTGTGVSLSHIYTAVGTYIVSLTVRDNDGGTGSDSLTVTVEEEATPDVMEDLPPDEAADIIEDMNTTEAADIIEEMNATAAADVVEEMNVITAAEIIVEVETEKAADIVEEMTEDAAVYVLVEVDTSSAATIMDAVEEEEAGDLINAAVQIGRTDQFSDIMLEMEENATAGALLASEPASGAEFVETMATKDLTKTAEIVEAAVKLRARELEPEAQEALLQKVATMLEEVSVESLVALFMEILTLPATPSTIATLFEVMDLETVLEVVEAWIDLEGYEGLAEVFDLLTQETLENIYLGMTPTDRAALYPYLSEETIAALPQVYADAGGPYTVRVDVSLTFDGTDSYDPDGTIVNYAWDFGDGESGTGSQPNHIYHSTGTYDVTLNVTDNDGLTDSDQTTVTVTPRPTYVPGKPNTQPVADAGPDQTAYIDQIVEFSGTNSYDPDGQIIRHVWNFGDGEEASGVNVSHTYPEPGNYTVSLTVGDNRNGEDSDTCMITVRETPPIIIPPLPPILSDLTITPAEIELGDEVTISLDIVNPNNRSITYNVTMQTGELTLLADIELEPYESKTVSRTITPETAGDYDVTVDGLTSSFTVNPVPTPPRPAEFEASNLQTTPEEAETGEEIEISFTVTNVGEETGNYAFYLLIEGPFVAGSIEMVGDLGAGESEIASYKLTLETPGDYTIEIDGLTGNFTVGPPIIIEPIPKPAEFVVSDLLASPDEVEEEETVMISVRITNIGETEGSYTVEFKVDGETIETETVTLAGGDSTTVTFEETWSAGTYQVNVEDLTKTFTVSEPPTPPLWMQPGALAGITLIIIIIAVILYAKSKGKLPIPIKGIMELRYVLSAPSVRRCGILRSTLSHSPYPPASPQAPVSSEPPSAPQ